MKRLSFFLSATVLLTSILVGQTVRNGWTTVPRSGYNLHYTQSDAGRVAEYSGMIDRGMGDAVGFFRAPYVHAFDVYVHPTRSSLDSTWRVEWKMPEFRSECWMVASGVATRLDLLSPSTWDTASCDHTTKDRVGMQRVITHELVHVFHGQHNPSPDFGDVSGLDWFVEGLATYASGQCDSARMAQVRKAVADHEVPQVLEKFWTGKWKYALSGSTVMYIDSKYGRDTLVGLLKITRLPDVLDTLHTTESEFLKGWRAFVLESK